MLRIGFLILLFILSLVGCNFMAPTRCDNKVIGRVLSPDGSYEAVTYERHCANKTGIYSWVGLKGTSSSRLDADFGEAVFTMTGLHEIKAVWLGPRKLEIESPGLLDRNKVLTQVESWQTITISYKSPP